MCVSQVRNRLWLQDAHRLGVSNSRDRIIDCFDKWIRPNEKVFFTTDDDSLYEVAQRRWRTRLTTQQGKVYRAWSQGSAVDARNLGEEDEVVVCPTSTHPPSNVSSIRLLRQEAVLKAVVDWFALQGASSILYTTQSSFGKTAAESSSVINLDLNRAFITPNLCVYQAAS